MELKKKKEILCNKSKNGIKLVGIVHLNELISSEISKKMYHPKVQIILNQ